MRQILGIGRFYTAVTQAIREFLDLAQPLFLMVGAHRLELWTR